MNAASTATEPDQLPMGSISGTVASEAIVGEDTGHSLGGIHLTAWDTNGNNVGSTTSQTFGSYEITGLAPGTYFVTADSSGEFLDELYFDLPCPDLGCDPTSGSPVLVQDQTVTSQIDFTLTRLGVISGTILDAFIFFPDRPVPADARAWNEAGELVSADTTDGFGQYSIVGLSPGIYYVDTLNSAGFIDQLYNGFPCPPDTCDRTAGTAIEVALNAPVTGINFLLDLQQGISGQVSRDGGGVPVPRALVRFWDATGSLISGTITDDSGLYDSTLPAGTVFVTTDAGDSPNGTSGELYDNLPCPTGLCDPTLGTPVTIQENEVTRNINFVLEIADDATCIPTELSLCLLDDRFQVQANWRDFEGQSGSARADAEVTDATGTFYFFGPDNTELVVKVLDACVEPFNHFWVFAAGLTNVEVELLVTDTLTGESKTYFNNLGQAFAPVQDTSAFATCEASRANEAEADALISSTQLEIEAQLAKLRAGQKHQSVSAANRTNTTQLGTCTPTATSLCLEQGRFRVESTWRTPAGETGDGQAVALTDASGTFWFFSPENVEALVKVLDACNLPGFENFWVFAAGLTDVEVTIRVTDTVSGEVKEYANPQSTPFLPIQDTQAFQTCGEMDG